MGRILRELSETYSAELKSKRDRLNDLLGAAHWLSVGTYKEMVLREQLRQRLPGKFQLGTGFVVARGALDGRVLSKQIDILVWNAAEHSPLFRTGDFVILGPEACAAAIEVKGHLTTEELADGITNLDSVAGCTATAYENEPTPFVPPFCALFAFEADVDVRFPTTVLNSLWSAYYKSPTPVAPRMSWSVNSNRDRRWTLPWIDAVAIMERGTVSLELWGIDGRDTPVHVAYDTGDKADDTYGFLERRLLLHLLGDRASGRLYDLPSTQTFLMGPHLQYPILGWMRMANQQGQISGIGRLTPPELAALIPKEVRPRKPRAAGKTKKKAPASAPASHVSHRKRNPRVP